MSYTITEDCILPSRGLIYSKPVNAMVKIRSMTTEEEMRRLAHTERPYKVLCDIIDSCIVGEGLGISSYDLALSDYQYMLLKLRIATYGPEYKILATCPHCGAINQELVDLANMPLRVIEEDAIPELSVQLPVTGKIVKIHLQTPRMLDDSNIKKKDLLKSNPIMETDPTVLYTLISMIESVDGTIYDRIKLDAFVRQLPMRDTNKILNLIRKVNGSFGYNMLLQHDCKECGLDYTSTFRVTAEFFGPTDD